MNSDWFLPNNKCALTQQKKCYCALPCKASEPELKRRKKEGNSRRHETLNEREREREMEHKYTFIFVVQWKSTNNDNNHYNKLQRYILLYKWCIYACILWHLSCSALHALRQIRISVFSGLFRVSSHSTDDGSICSSRYHAWHIIHMHGARTRPKETVVNDQRSPPHRNVLFEAPCTGRSIQAHKYV